MDAPCFLAAFGRNDAAGSESLADMSMVEFRIELGAGQYYADRADCVGGVDQRVQVGGVVGRAGAWAFCASISGRCRSTTTSHFSQCRFAPSG